MLLLQRCAKQRPWLRGCGSASCSLLIAATTSVSARVRDSHAAWAVIIVSPVRATLGRDSKSWLVYSRGWNSTKIHPFSSAPEHTEAADSSLCQGEARYFWTLKQKLSRHAWRGGIRLLWWKIGTMNSNVSLNSHPDHNYSHYESFKVGNIIILWFRSGLIFRFRVKEVWYIYIMNCHKSQVNLTEECFGFLRNIPYALRYTF